MHIQESLLLHLPSEDAGALASGRLQCLLIAAVTQSVSGHIFLTRVYFIKGLINKMVKKKYSLHVVSFSFPLSLSNTESYQSFCTDNSTTHKHQFSRTASRYLGSSSKIITANIAQICQYDYFFFPLCRTSSNC